MSGETVKSKGLWGRWQGVTLWKKVLIGLALGVVVGVTVGDVVNPYLGPVGEIFKRLFRMLIVPLIFFSLVSGITSMTDLKEMGRVGGKTFIIYILTTAIAVAIGLGFGIVFQPGAGAALGSGYEIQPNGARTAGEFLINLIPLNPVAAFAEGNVLQIITFAILVGVAINLAGNKVTHINHFMDEASEVMYSLTHIVIQITPYGVFALMAVISAKYGLDVLLPLGKLVLVVYAA